MARSHAAVPSGGWPTQRPAAEADPRSARAVPAGQRPAQPGAPAAQGSGYPQAGYPEQQGQAPAYDPQLTYHYPQTAQQAPAPSPRQGLSSLESVGQAGSEYAPYPATQQPYGHTPQGPQPVRNSAPTAGSDYRQGGGYEQWPAAVPLQDPRDYNFGYPPAGASRPAPGSAHAEPDPHADPLQQQPEWAHPAFADGASEEAYHAGQMGYEQQAHAGALEQGYNPEEAADYDGDEPRRGSWVMRIGGAIVVAIALGYGLAQGYKLMSSTEPEGATPIVRGDSAPAKTKPADPGGKQFAHTDSKVMGRLGEGAPSSETSTSSSSDLSASDSDSSSTRKVTTLTVGRDGTISSPPPPAEPVSSTATVAAPGLTVVDGFGGRYPMGLTTSSTSSPAKDTSTPAKDTSPPAKEESAKAPEAAPQPKPEPKPEVIAKVTPVNVPLDISDKPAAEAKKETPPAAAAPAKSSATNGYVVVLASFPVSSQSRLIALKRYADMQEKYGSVLQNKTPDVQEANLGERGNYHRLLVGPPGSRSQASTLCSELKTAGYKDCWVMAY